MNKKAIIRPWEMLFPIKLIIWVVFSFPVLGMVFPFMDLLERDPFDWASFLGLSIFYGGFILAYYLGVLYNRKLTRTVEWLAEEMHLEAYVSRGAFPGFIYWPEVSGETPQGKVSLTLSVFGRSRYTILTLPVALTSEAGVQKIKDGIAKKEFFGRLGVTADKRNLVFEGNGCIANKKTAEFFLGIYQTLTRTSRF